MRKLNLYSRVKNKVNRGVAFIFLVVLLVFSSTGFSYQIRGAKKQTELGVSFSKKYADELGIDWKRAYLALLDDIGVKNLRLMSYWDLHEPEQDNYDFSDLDWQIDQANRHNVNVSLSIGERQPRWPECHVPDWAKTLPVKERQSHLLNYIDVVVTRYKDQPAIASYQIENEVANRLFGECDAYDRDFYAQEINLVKNLDQDATIISNVSNQSGIPYFGPVNQVDKVGFSIYKKAHFEAFGEQRAWSFWYIPSLWHSTRAGLTEGFTGKQTFVHELQAEPWGPKATVDLSFEEQNKTMDSNQLKSIVNFAKSTGMNEIYLWGGEWWYWRLSEFNDKQLWQTVRDFYQSN